MGAARHKRWSEAEIALLDTRRATSTPAQIAAELGRSVNSVAGRLQIDNERRRKARERAAYGTPQTKLTVEHAEFPPPAYVLRERAIRWSIPATSVTQVMFSDPVEGYSALANKIRKISVQDALEICALYNGKGGEIFTLARAYGISPTTIKSILNGSFFDRLAPPRAGKPQKVTA